MSKLRRDLTPAQRRRVIEIRERRRRDAERDYLVMVFLLRYAVAGSVGLVLLLGALGAFK